MCTLISLPSSTQWRDGIDDRRYLNCVASVDQFCLSTLILEQGSVAEAVEWWDKFSQHKVRHGGCFFADVSHSHHGHQYSSHSHIPRFFSALCSTLQACAIPLCRGEIVRERVTLFAQVLNRRETYLPATSVERLAILGDFALEILHDYALSSSVLACTSHQVSSAMHMVSSCSWWLTAYTVGWMNSTTA
jgi:hypothetical protein